MKLSRSEYESMLKRPAIAKRNAPVSNPSYSSRTVAFVESNTGDVTVGKTRLQKAGGPSFKVRVISVRNRLIDEDNLAAKFVVDQCRYAGLLPDDNPETARIEVTQRYCRFDEYEHVEITIERI